MALSSYARRASALIAAPVALVLLAAPAAVAAPAVPHPHGRVTGPTPYPAPAFNDPAGHTCPFAIHVSFPVNKTKVYTYHNHGRVTAYMYVGALYAKVTRRSTGVSRTVNLSGSGVQVLHRDGSSDFYGFGPFASLLHPGDSPHREFAILHGVSLVQLRRATARPASRWRPAGSGERTQAHCLQQPRLRPVRPAALTARRGGSVTSGR